MQVNTHRLLAWFVHPFILTIPFSVFMGYAALEHNPQEEFCTYVQIGLVGNYESGGAACLIKWDSLIELIAVWTLAQIAVYSVLRIFWTSWRGKPNATR